MTLPVGFFCTVYQFDTLVLYTKSEQASYMKGVSPLIRVNAYKGLVLVVDDGGKIPPSDRLTL